MSDTNYTKIKNDVLEALIRYRISGEEMMILLLIIRKTWGYGKNEDDISLSQFYEATGMKKPSIIRSINKLLSKNIISKKANEGLNKYAVNSIFATWKPLAKKLMTKPLAKKLMTKPLAKKLIKVSKKANESLAKKLPTIDNKEKRNNVNVSIDIVRAQYYGEILANELRDPNSTAFYIKACGVIDPHALIKKAKEIIQDGGAHNPGAVFTDWYKKTIEPNILKDQIADIANSKSM